LKAMNERKSAWGSKSEMAEKARKHTELMASKYKDEIDHSIRTSTIHQDLSKQNLRSGDYPEIFISDCDTIKAAESWTKQDQYANVTILNFASYKFAGGMFIEGSKAQEEAICHRTFLYNVLSDSKFEKEYYWQNRQRTNRGLYLNKAIYSQGIRLFNEDDTPEGSTVNVITCAAPNVSAYKTWCEYQKVNFNKHLVKDITEQRCRFVVNVAEQHDVNILILGAFGCGVFSCDPKIMAQSFKDALKGSRIHTVMFAIPNTNNGNHTTFAEVLGNDARRISI